MEAIKIGDVVAWADVPDGALVRREAGDGLVAYSIRQGDIGRNCSMQGDWFDPAGGWAWCYFPNDRTPARIIALNVPADATAEDLRALAERFEVREAVGILTMDEALDLAADVLCRAGWRKGMTAEDAARLLTAQEAR